MSVPMATLADTATDTGLPSAETGLQPLALLVPPQVADALAQQVADIVIARLGDRPEYLSTEEVAAYLGWPKKRIDNLCAQSRIPFHKDGGRRVFVRQEINGWINDLPGTTVRDALLMSSS
jgi:excisionase family DNA binding protein